MGMLSKVLLPLNSLGIPVAKYLNMIMFIVNQLSQSVSQFKQDILEQVRCIFKSNRLGFKTKFKELSNLLINFIANSLQQTDEIQEQIELIDASECQYTLTISKHEIVAMISFIIFLLLFLVF
jgi:energy-coupling factor transporter transmembrane protein EcfT